MSGDRQPLLFEAAPKGRDWNAPARAESASSAAGAEAVRRSGTVGKQCRAILHCLNILGPKARFELMALVPRLSVNAACGRIGELKDPDRRRHAMLARPAMIRVVGKTKSPAGILVDVYAITEAGKQELRKTKRSPRWKSRRQ